MLLSAHTFVIWKFSKIRNKKIHFHRWPYAFVCVRDSLPAGDTYRPWITQSPADDNDYRITDVSNFTRISPPPYSRDTCIRLHFDPIEGVTRRNSGRRTDRGVIRSTQCERAASEWLKRRSRGLPESGFVERENRTLCWSQSFRVGAAERPVETRASVPLIHSPLRLLRENCKKKDRNDTSSEALLACHHTQASRRSTRQAINRHENTRGTKGTENRRKTAGRLG